MRFWLEARGQELAKLGREEAEDIGGDGVGDGNCREGTARAAARGQEHPYSAPTS